jgi:D-alanyl-D-alanine carboxypeptidase (penicillin-binding protein 5/6)
VVIALAVALFALLSSGGAVVALRVSAAPPAPHLAIAAAGSLSAGGAAPAITVPLRGSMALVASGKHLLGSGFAELLSDDAGAVRPIASVAKTLTALVVLGAKPLAATESGPGYVITAPDVAFYARSVADGGSSTFVSLGEVFSEQQLLEALMLPSGNNIAETLAVWVAGSVASFVTQENAAAQSLGMTSTTITDPSGFDSGTRSTASDLVKLGTAAIGNPALAAIVAERSARLPSGQAVPNFDTALGQPGWLGIKTGDSDAAGGCLLFAVRRAPVGDGNPEDAITLVGAVIGERSLLARAGGDDDRAAAIYAAEQAVNTAMAGYVAVRASTLTAAPALSGAVTTDWGGSSPLALGPAVLASSAVVRSGTALFLQTQMRRITAPLAAGVQVGTVEALVGNEVALSWPVLTTRAIAAPGFWWRLQHD